MYIDGDIWLADDGQILRLVNGNSAGWSAAAPGDAILRDAPTYRLIASGAERRTGTIYGFDTGNDRVVGAVEGQRRVRRPVPARRGRDRLERLPRLVRRAGPRPGAGRDRVDQRDGPAPRHAAADAHVRARRRRRAPREGARRPAPASDPAPRSEPDAPSPVVTLILIGACFAAFALELSVTATGGDAGAGAFFRAWGAVPADMTRALEAGNYLGQATLGMFTSMFLHGSWLHLLGNMLFLWIFGNNVEDRFGRLPFLLFYLVGGIAAALTQVVIDPQSTIPLVGASGAIAAALGAYIVLFPGARILSLVFLGFFYQLLEVPALVVLGLLVRAPARQRLRGVRRGDRAGRRGVLRPHRRASCWAWRSGCSCAIVGAGAARRGPTLGAMG